MTPVLVLRAQAEEEVREAVRMYQKVAPELGAEFVRHLRAALDQIVLHPDAGKPHSSGTRRRLLSRFPFSVVYLQLPGRIEIVAVVHQRRNPGYWLDRL